MVLTPIKVRGKNRKPTTAAGSKQRGRGRPFKSRINSSASNTDVELSSQHGSDSNPRKRRKTQRARSLAPLESLPTEILQNIFFRSRNADLMFASKPIMQKLEKSEHVKTEFCFSTLLWPIINGEVDPDINDRPNPSLHSDDDDDDSPDSLLAQAQSRLLSCRFFTRGFCHSYFVKAFEKWNTLHAPSQPDRVVEMPKVDWADRFPCRSDEKNTEFFWIFSLPYVPTVYSVREAERDEQVRELRKRLGPIAFHPSTRVPIKFFRLSAYNTNYWHIEGAEPSHFGRPFQYELLGFLGRALGMRPPVTGEAFDDLVREVARTGNQHLMRPVLWFRVWEPSVTTPLPSDLLRILVLEADCPRRIVEGVIEAGAHLKAAITQNDLFDPAIWAWAEKNGEVGEWLRGRMRRRLDAP